MTKIIFNKFGLVSLGRFQFYSKISYLFMSVHLQTMVDNGGHREFCSFLREEFAELLSIRNNKTNID